VLEGRGLATVGRRAVRCELQAVRVAGQAMWLSERAGRDRALAIMFVPSGGRCRRKGTRDEREGAQCGSEGVLVGGRGARVNPRAMRVVRRAVRIDDLAVRSRDHAVHSYSDAGRVRRVGMSARRHAARVNAGAVRCGCLSVRCGRRAGCSHRRSVRCASEALRCAEMMGRPGRGRYPPWSNLCRRCRDLSVPRGPASSRPESHWGQAGLPRQGATTRVRLVPCFAGTCQYSGECLSGGGLPTRLRARLCSRESGAGPAGPLTALYVDG
jgi:hypothetical protein